MPFSLTNAPTTFQNIMNHIFRKALRKGVLVYFDDVLIYSKSWTEHLEKLEEVLGIMREHMFFAKKSKCSFIVDRVEFLGFIVF